jgi:hypothetical protein
MADEGVTRSQLDNETERWPGVGSSPPNRNASTAGRLDVVGTVRVDQAEEERTRGRIGLDAVERDGRS